MIRRNAEIVISSLVMIHLLLGLAWFALPVFTISCRTTIHTVFRHPPPLPELLFDWLAWPWDVRTVYMEAAEEGLSPNEIRTLVYCPHDDDLWFGQGHPRGLLNGVVRFNATA